jgi:hypothetical protein
VQMDPFDRLRAGGMMEMQANLANTDTGGEFTLGAPRLEDPVGIMVHLEHPARMVIPSPAVACARASAVTALLALAGTTPGIACGSSQHRSTPSPKPLSKPG